MQDSFDSASYSSEYGKKMGGKQSRKNRKFKKAGQRMSSRAGQRMSSRAGQRMSSRAGKKFRK